MVDAVRSLYGLIDPRDRRQLWIVFGLTIVLAVAEAAGVASIMPFVSVATNPELIDSTPYLTRLFQLSGAASRQDFMLLLGAGSVVLLIGSLMIRAVALWAQLRFSHQQIASLSARLVSGYLSLPYPWYLNRNSADLGAKMLTEVGNVIQGTLYPLMTGLAHGLVSTALVTVLVVTDPILALTASICICGVYGLLFLAARRPLTKAGVIRMKANADRYRALAEAFGGIKEVKKSGLEAFFLEKFRTPSLVMAQRGITAQLLTEMPSLVMQGVIFGGMVLIILYLMQVHGGLSGAVPVVAVYTLGGSRLMPELQGLYRDLSLARYNSPAAIALHRDWTMIQEMGPRGERPVRQSIGPLGDELRLVDVSYSYPSSSRHALRNLSFSIKACSTTGIVGLTGSGKTTLVDVLLGLLAPDRGQIEFDGTRPDRDTLRTWQRTIGYVPQNIFLCDDTVASNIAFGIEPARIDRAALERAALAAGIHGFVTNSLPQGYDTVIGERGIRLSGGQRQRIGIARALYHDPDTLVLDEATSALDNLTEQAVLDAIYALGGKKTIIVIAHRLSTIRHCHRIVVMDDGMVEAVGTYSDLTTSSVRFRSLVHAASTSTQSANAPA